MGVVGVYDKVLGERSLLLAKSCVTQALGTWFLKNRPGALEEVSEPAFSSEVSSGCVCGGKTGNSWLYGY